MTTPLIPFYAGSSLTAAELNAIQPLQVIKQASQSVTSSATLVNDNALSVTLGVASAQYIFQAFFYYQGGTGGSSDMKFEWLVPSGATLEYAILGNGSGGGSLLGNGYTGGSVQTLRTQTLTTPCAAVMYGTLIVAATTGTLQLQWAQNTPSGTATSMLAGSSVTLVRVS